MLKMPLGGKSQPAGFTIMITYIPLHYFLKIHQFIIEILNKDAISFQCVI